MIDIDEYILLAKSLPNTSAGGSKSYIIGDKVLVCYEIPNKYGVARKDEELVAAGVNKLADKGVRTPRHLGIKREIDGDRNYCWVLQEKADGLNFSMYCDDEVVMNQIRNANIIASAPQEHYDKYVADIIALYYFGLELKAKNIFYDTEKGFTIIDLLDDGSNKSFDPTSLKDIKYLFSLTYSLTLCCLSWYSKATEEEKALSEELKSIIQLKTYYAVLHNVPNFQNYERWVLRSFDNKVLDGFSNLGYGIPNLVLNDQEIDEFHSMIDVIAGNALEEIKTGKSKLWQVECNTIRIALEERGLFDSWMYSPENTRDRNDKPDDFDDDFEYNDYYYVDACKKDLLKMVMGMFYERLAKEAENSDNSYVKEAYEEYLEKNKEKKATLI